MESAKEYNILKLRKGVLQSEIDLIIKEYPFTVFVNNKEIVTFLCTPKSLKFLAAGFLYSEGIINSKSDIEDIQIDEDQGRAYVFTQNKDIFAFDGDRLCGKRTVTTACGKQRTISYNVVDFLGTESDKIKSRIEFESAEILALMNGFNKRSELFLTTGGVHSCALCDRKQMILFEEDVGRHNALDKILGKALLEDIYLEDKIIATSGRISSEMVMKVLKRKIPILVSRSAPTDLAVDMARKCNLTLIGFARGEKLNIYSE